MEQVVIMVLLFFLTVLAVSIIYLKDVLTSVILLGIYSLVAAAVFLVMDAVDVAFTEAAVGAGISTILLLGTLNLTRQQPENPETETETETETDYSRRAYHFSAFIIVCLTGGLLIYGTLDMPHYGDDNSAAYQHPQLAQHYIHQSDNETAIPNIVTSVLASYRGYDTLGETVVVFTAAIGVLSLLGLRRRRQRDNTTPEQSNNKGEKT